MLLPLLVITVPLVTPDATDVPTGFDNQSNGMVDDQTHRADQQKFDQVEGLADGLGPLFNAQSCRECHQNPVSGASSQITELRVGHLAPDGRFHNPDIPIARGTQVISGRTLVNDRAICPNATFPDTEVQERVPPSESIRTTRLAVNLLGDGFVEAVADQTLIDLARTQCKSTHGKICGLPIHVPIIEAPGQSGIGRFGWKDQHASLLSFSGDAYLNETGITNPLFPDEVTNLCNTVSEPNDTPGPDGLSDIDHFARFVRASKGPAVDSTLANTPQAQRGSKLFDQIGCSNCHARTLTTASAGTKINGGTFIIPQALGGKTFHPFGDFLLHDVGTGDGIVIAVVEHYSRAAHDMPQSVSTVDLEKSRNRIRTAPLWGLRFHSRLMHDGASLTPLDAIHRHAGEASEAARGFRRLPQSDQQTIIYFLNTL